MMTLKSRSLTSCPVCNSDSRQLFVKRIGKRFFPIRVCQVCSHQFVEMAIDEDHVERIYDDGYFQGRGTGYQDYLREGKYHRLRGHWYSRLVRRCLQRPGTVLDVGAAGGFVLQGLIDRGWRGSGIEPNLQMVNHARQQFSLRMHRLPLQDFKGTEPVDLVMMLQVIEHLTDLQDSFRIAAEVTRSHGYWLIETHNRQSWPALLLGNRWSAYRPPMLLHWFSPKDLQRLVAQYGFQEVARGQPPRWMNAGHAKYALRQRGAIGALLSALLAVVPDDLPLPLAASDRFWVLYKKVW